MTTFRLSVAPLPTWLDARRLLGVGCPLAVTPIGPAHVRIEARVSASEAADVGARLRGVGIDGRALEIVVDPPLPRALVRAARLRDARLRRTLTPGFTVPGGRAEGEGRYSLTPASLAHQIGLLAEGRSVVDACCGSGGNAIGFARAGCAVTAIERDPERLVEARHNARLYGVSDRLTFVHGDALDEVPRRTAALLFVDPPWGLDYDKRCSERAQFPLLDALIARVRSGYDAIWAKVPGSFAVSSVGGAEASGWFGEAAGDAHRLKFVLLQKTLAPTE